MSAALLKQMFSAFVEAVKAGGQHGAPAGVMYAAVQDKLSLGKFNIIMQVLVDVGAVRREGDLYFFVRDLP